MRGYGAQPHVAGPIGAAKQRPVLRAHPLQAQQPQQAYQAPPRGRSVGELQKVDSAALKSRLFIFERLDLELSGPSWPNRLAPVGRIRWVNFAEQAWVNSDERQGSGGTREHNATAAPELP